MTELNKIFNNALACHQAGQSQQAAELYRQILNIDGDHAQASNNLGAIFMSTGSMGEAVSCFQNAVYANADFFEAHLNLAGAYKKMGRYSEATDSFRRALAIKPDHIPASADAGRFLVGGPRFVPVCRRFRRAVLRGRRVAGDEL